MKDRSHRIRAPRSDPYLFFGVGVTIAVGGLAILLMFFTPLSVVLALFVSANAVGVFAMGLDKALSRSGSLRIPEAVIFLLALLGGSLGILLGMQIVRHKTQKVFFHAVLFLIVAAQLSLYTLFKGGME
jgi:uncharacterized membrane protein YsdA (DUF1294 family)